MVQFLALFFVLLGFGSEVFCQRSFYNMWKPIQQQMAQRNAMKFPVDKFDIPQQNQVQKQQRSYEDLTVVEEPVEKVPYEVDSNIEQPELAEVVEVIEEIPGEIVEAAESKKKEITPVTDKDQIILPEQKLNFIAPFDYFIDAETKLINPVIKAKPQKAVVKIPVHVYAQPVYFPMKHKKPIYYKPHPYKPAPYMPYHDKPSYGRKPYEPVYEPYSRKPSYGHNKKGGRFYN